MNLVKLKKSSIDRLLGLVQILLLFYYLALNVINVGEMGVALPLLIGFIGLGFCRLFLQSTYQSLAVSFHFFILLMFLIWLAIRVIIDLNDIEYLKQVTLGTTGGILLFFMIGSLARYSLNTIAITEKSLWAAKIILFIFLLFSFNVFVEFSSKIVRIDILLIDDLEGGYQRPGNFFIIFFAMVSFVFLKLISQNFTKNLFSLIFWLTIYSAGVFLALISSQMIGSNAATANILVIYLITVVISIIGFNKKIRSYFLNSGVSLNFLNKIAKKNIHYSMMTIIVIFFISILALKVSDFDVNTMRAFGFGAGGNDSLISRFIIFKETAIDQMGYSPIFGNMNVAYLTTGNTGRYLHNFIPNIIAEMGLIGLIIILILILLVFKVVIKNMRMTSLDVQGFQEFIVNFWVFFILLFLFIYANIAVSKSWLVIWFFIGFSAPALVVNKN